MPMITSSKRRNLGTLFYLRRKELGLSQESMEERLSEYGISGATYRRAERGYTCVSETALLRICVALDLDESMLDPDVTKLMSLSTRLETFLNNRDPISADLYIFLLYLPLFPTPLLQDFLYRIHGNFLQNRGYIDAQKKYLFDQVPESSAKEYVDSLTRLFLKEYLDINTNEIDCNKTVFSETEFLRSERSLAAHMAYMDRISSLGSQCT